MLVCGCGWGGCNLIPNWKHDTAHCPECLITFKGVKAGNAKAVSEIEELEITNDYEKIKFLCG